MSRDSEPITDSTDSKTLARISYTTTLVFEQLGEIDPLPDAELESAVQSLFQQAERLASIAHAELARRGEGHLLEAERDRAFARARGAVPAGPGSRDDDDA